MDTKAIIERLQTARRGLVAAAGATFEVTLPSDHDYRATIEAHRSGQGVIQEARAFRAILESAITGWQGVTVGHILPDGGVEALPFSAENRALLLDNDQELADLLIIEVARLKRERTAAREEARKNSSRASSGS